LLHSNDSVGAVRYLKNSSKPFWRQSELKALKIMIADDHAELLRALTRWLGRKFEVIAAVKDGQKLVDEAVSQKPDVIVSDVVMPQMSGTQAREELALRGCNVPFVFLTCETDLVGEGMGSVVDKLDAHNELEAAILTAASGEVYLSRRVHGEQDIKQSKKGHLPSPQKRRSGRE
jgi:DNA-binding NarL/FixJ family response regulator